jgi:hypothetical protein
MTQAAFVELLGEHGLTGVDGARTIEQLGQLYGVSRWYDFIEAIYLPPSPLFSENRERYYIPIYTPTTLVPPAEFCCDFDFTGKGFENHQLALTRLSDLFGPPEKGIAVNTWSHTWWFERAKLMLTTFIREKTTGYNPLYQRHPELWEKCSIRIQIDPVALLSAEEESYLLSVPLADRLEFPLQNLREQSLAYPAWRRGCLPTNQLVCWGDLSRARIGWYHASSAVFWEAAICSGIKLVRLSPARGSGNATVYLVMRNPFSRGREEVTEVVLRADDWNGLNVAAPKLAEFWALPLQVEEYPDE